jgi:periplasmic protein TonB
MFEDSTFESNGRIRTRSRGWMVAALLLDATILLAFILIPLVHPEGLPRQAMAFLMEVPPPPATPPPLPHQALHAATSASETSQDLIQAPRQIPRIISIPSGPEPEGLANVAAMDPNSGTPGGFGDAFRTQPAPRVVHPELKGPMPVPSAVAAGLLIRKVIPPYPQLAKTMHVEGTVALAATISKTGTIVNLRVVSGPPMLQQAALDAVSNWRYRPYLLNGQPVDVETTINVIFTLGG